MSRIGSNAASIKTGSPSKNREFTLSDKDFDRLRKLVYQMTGISLNEAKRDLVYSRFTKRLRALELESFSEYCRLVEAGEIDEAEEFANAITTNLTAFFRERHHFDYLASQVVPEIRARASRRFRVWSAGCSSGEEPYSIAITLLENWPDMDLWDTKMLATDLDSSVVRKAAAGEYDHQRIATVGAASQRRWFEAVNDKIMRVRPEVRRLLSFRQLNLMNEWPMSGPFDVIFCRNTVIYFDKPTQRTLFDRYAELQNVGDYLFIGHSESLNHVTTRYELIGQTIYRKIA
jgi:chemotaxis protein methyltransferase CheR